MTFLSNPTSNDLLSRLVSGRQEDVLDIQNAPSGPIPDPSADDTQRPPTVSEAAAVSR